MDNYSLYEPLSGTKQDAPKFEPRKLKSRSEGTTHHLEQSPEDEASMGYVADIGCQKSTICVDVGAVST
jgi:hypothetical protein